MVELLARRLALQQEGQRPDQHRLGLDAQLLRLRVVLQRLAGAEAELHAALELGDDVVVVRVEPLRHLHRRHVDAAGLTAACHREVGVEVDVARPVPLVAGRHGTDHRDGVEHLVVEREVVGRDQVDPGVALELPVRGAQLLGGPQQVLHRAVSRPVGLGRGLELTLGADARKPQHVGKCLWQENLLNRGELGPISRTPKGARTERRSITRCRRFATEIAATEPFVDDRRTAWCGASSFAAGRTIDPHARNQPTSHRLPRPLRRGPRHPGPLRRRLHTRQPPTSRGPGSRRRVAPYELAASAVAASASRANSQELPIISSISRTSHGFEPSAGRKSSARPRA